MQKQHYMSGGYASDGIIEAMLRKMAATPFDMREDDAIDVLSAPQETPKPYEGNDTLQQTVNESNGLPRSNTPESRITEQNNRRYMIQEYEPENETHKALLTILEEQGPGIGTVRGTYTYNISGGPNSFEIKFIPVKQQKAGLVIEHK